MGMRLDEVERVRSAYPDIPLEAIYKEDLLRTGIAFSEDALRIASGFKPKAYFIFSFDLVPISEMPSGEHLRVPEEIALEGGALVLTLDEEVSDALPPQAPMTSASKRRTERRLMERP